MSQEKIEVGWARMGTGDCIYSKQIDTMSGVSTMMNSFAALCESDDNEVVVESVAVAPTYNTMTSEERITAALAKVRSVPIPVLPPGGIDLIAMSPELARMAYAMRNGMSWYDMFLYDEELDEFRKRGDERVARGEPRYLPCPAPRVEPTEVIDCDDWTDVRRVKTNTRSHPKKKRERRVETQEVCRQESWGW
jgi:hypothetical protein